MNQSGSQKSSSSKKLEYAKFLSTLEEEECRALTEEVIVIVIVTTVIKFLITSQSIQNSILPKSNPPTRIPGAPRIFSFVIFCCSGNPCPVSQSGASSGSPTKTSSATAKDTSCAFHLRLKRILPDPPRRSFKSSGSSWRVTQDPRGLEPSKPSWRILPETGTSHRAGKSETPT